MLFCIFCSPAANPSAADEELERFSSVTHCAIAGVPYLYPYAAQISSKYSNFSSSLAVICHKGLSFIPTLLQDINRLDIKQINKSLIVIHPPENKLFTF
jgi:hypothetical protein